MKTFRKIVAQALSLLVLFSIFTIAASAAASPPYIGKVVTKSTALRMRTGPGTNHEYLYDGKTLIQIPRGTEITVLKTVPCDDNTTKYSWHYVAYETASKTYKAYVASTFVQYVGEVPGPEPPQPPTPDPPKPIIPPVNPDESVDVSHIPDIYKPYLLGFAYRHPNWKFSFYDTGLDWNTVINEESKQNRNLINASLRYIYRDPSQADTPVEGKTWFLADRKAVSYYMDPRNLMDERHIFQFQMLSYDETLQNLRGVETIIAGTYMDGKTIVTTDHRTVTYAQAIMEAAQQSGASPYHLATRIIQETGVHGSGSVSGNYVGKDGISRAGYYNFYNIGAGTKGDTVANALDWAAKTGEEKNYGRPWDTPYKSIVEGAKWIATGYISQGQDTLYFQKFDVVKPGLYWHQYMTNVSAPHSEAEMTYKKYKELNILENPYVFKIPIYRNMPSVQHLPDFTDRSVKGDYYGRLCGDVNDDGVLTLADYQNLVDSALNLDYIAPDGTAFILRDMNDDGNIDMFDVSIMDLLLRDKITM